jgi:hypothetical protein
MINAAKRCKALFSVNLEDQFLLQNAISPFANSLSNDNASFAHAQYDGSIGKENNQMVNPPPQHQRQAALVGLAACGPLTKSIDVFPIVTQSSNTYRRDNHAVI